jgi:hypothetical protein
LIERIAVIDARAGYVFGAGSVDENAHAELVRFMIELAGLLVELRLVAKPTAPASRNTEVQRVTLAPIARQELSDIGRGRRCQRHEAHRSNLVRGACLDRDRGAPAPPAHRRELRSASVGLSALEPGER